MEVSNIDNHYICMYSISTTETLRATPQADIHFFKPRVKRLQNEWDKVVIYALVMCD